MACATGSGGVAGERAAGASEAVVERDGGGQCGEAHGDALADPRQMRSAPALVLAARAVDRRVECGELGLKAPAAEVLVADQRQLAGLAFAARDQLQADGLLIELGRGQRQR